MSRYVGLASNKALDRGLFLPRTTNRAKGDGNMQLLNFQMFYIGLWPGVFQDIHWAREESFKIYSGHARSLSKHTLGTS